MIFLRSDVKPVEMFPIAGVPTLWRRGMVILSPPMSNTDSSPWRGRSPPISGTRLGRVI